MRAEAQNVLSNLGRPIGGFGPSAMGTPAEACGFDAATALSAVLYRTDVLAVVALVPERRGQPLA